MANGMYVLIIFLIFSCRPWEWWLKLWENVGMPMEQLGWQLCELKKHCHSSANRKASKCNRSFEGTLLSSYLLLGVFGRPVVLPHWERTEDAASSCCSGMWLIESFPGFLWAQRQPQGSFACTMDASSQDSYRMLSSLLLFLLTKLVFRRWLLAL